MISENLKFNVSHIHTCFMVLFKKEKKRAGTFFKTSPLTVAQNDYEQHADE